MTGDSPSLPEPEWEPWEVHEHPGRLLDPGAILCACVACEAAIMAQARSTPHMALGLATASDRIVVTAEYLAEVMAVDRTLKPLFYVADDYVRRLYVVVDGWLWPSRRWWSAACNDDEAAAGRRHLRHRVAKRQSRADRARRAAAVAADQPLPLDPVLLELTPLPTAVAPVRQRHRELLAELREWALEHGQRADLDLMALVLAGKESPLADAPLHRWTRKGVNHCLSIDVNNWCSRTRVLVPEGVSQALWQLLDFMVATDRLHCDSDPLDELRKPLRCYGGLDHTGRPRSDDESALRCECYVTYRGPTYGELSDVPPLAAADDTTQGHRCA
jgi:hypothetical protein